MPVMKVSFASRKSAKGRNPRQAREFSPETERVVLSREGIHQIDLDFPQGNRLQQLDLSWNRLTQIDLEPLSGCKGLVHLDISWNILKRADLSPLSECAGLRRIILDGNHIAKIDLTPLAGLKELREIQLSRNSLTNVDLAPLRSCTALDSLSFRNNRLAEIDLTPLADCSNLQKLEIAGNRLSEVDLSPFIHRADGPEHLDCGRQRKKGFNVTADPLLAITNWSLAVHVDEWKGASRFVEPLVKTLKWSGFADMVRGVIKQVNEARRQEKRVPRPSLSQIMYLVLDMRELKAYPGSVVDFFNEVSDEMDYKTGRRYIYEKTVDAISAYIERGASTAYFDVERMASTSAARLVPQILRSRREEVEKAALKVRGGIVDLSRLWKTYYGAQVLTALRLGETTNSRGLAKVESAFAQLGIELRKQDTPEPPT